MRLGKRERKALIQARIEYLAVKARANAVSNEPINTSLNKALILPSGHPKPQTCGWYESNARKIGRWGTTRKVA